MFRVQIRYQGRVQGVGFRATARSIAASHPVTGWVRNESDGSVLLEAQGACTNVELFLEDIRAAFAQRITREDRVERTPTNDESAFVIAR